MKKMAILACLILLLPLASQVHSGMEKADLLRIRESRREMQKSLLEAIRSAKQPIKLEVDGQEDFDVTYYRLDLSVDVDNQLLDGTVTIRANSLVSGLNEIILNFYDEMPVTSVAGDASGFSHADNVVTIDLDRTYTAGQSFEVMVHYNGHPWEGNLGLSFVTNVYTYNRQLVYTECSPFFARAWWPCKDTPMDKADSMDLLITLPNDLTLASIGVLQDVVDNGDGTKTWHWHEGHPIATYLVSITAYPYQTFTETYEGLQGQQMDVQFYVYPEDFGNASEDFNSLVEMIDFFADMYTEYPFINEKYGMAEYSGYYAAMEHQTCTSYGSYYITGDHQWDYIIAHELGHSWWGNSLSVGSWHDVWLKEGFASYSEALWMENIYGPYGLQEYMVNTQLAIDLTESVYRYDVSDANNIFISEVYDKGAWVLHMLRHVVGDDTFFQILQQVYETYAFGNYTTEQFQAACEQISGQDLDWFFDEWVYDLWHPEFYWGWSVNDLGGSYEVSGFIDQIQDDGPIFTMPLDMAIVTGSGDTMIATVVWVDEASDRFHFEVGDEPTNILLDPSNWILQEQGITTEPIATYASHSISDAGGDGDGRPDPGETVNLIVDVKNIGVDVFGLSATLSTTDPDIEIPSPTAPYGDIIHGATSDNAAYPFSLNIDPAADTHIATCILSFSNQNGYAGADTFYMTIGTPAILLVDDDGPESFENYYLRSFVAKALPFQVWNVSHEGTPGDTLSFFDVVIWLTATERENTLTGDDQTALAAYLDGGGGLFLSGQDIGHDLSEMGNGPDFFTDYLHASLIADVSSEYFLQGVSGDPISGEINLIQLSGEQESPDVIAPLEGTSTTLAYSPSGNAAGIKYGGDFRVVYFAVGFEGLERLAGNSESLRADILENIVAWLQFQATKGDVNEDGKINIIDVIWTVNIVLGLTQPTPSQEWAADYDGNGSVNVVDAIGIVNIILGPVPKR
jgi:aminopeptidase N